MNRIKASNIPKASATLAQILVLFAIVPIFFQVGCNGLENSKEGTCGFECWLANLTIAIPDVSTVEYGFELEISDLTCSGINILGVNSTFNPTSPTDFSMNPYGIGLQCTANWAFRQVDWPHVSGSGGVQVQVENSDMGLAIQLVQAEDGLAEQAKVTNCSTSINVTTIDFSGGIISDILDLFESFISEEVETGLDTVICSQLTSLIEVNLTNILLQVDNQIRPYMVPPAIKVLPPLPGMVNLQNNSVVNLVAFLMHNVLASDSVLSINRLVDRFLNSSGNVTLGQSDLNATRVSSSIASLAEISFGLTSLTLEGLDTWSNVELHAMGDYLVTDLKLDYLAINATFFINVTTNSSIASGVSLYEEAQVYLITSLNSMNGSLLLLLKQDAIEKLSGSQFEQLGCIAATVYNANISNLFFQMQVEALTITAVGGDIEAQIDAMINNLLALFTYSFDAAIPAFFNGFVAQPIVDLLNNVTTDLIKRNTTCAAPGPPPLTFNEFITTYAFIGAAATFGAIIITIGLISVKRFIARKKAGKKPGYTDSSPLLPQFPEEDKSALIMHTKIPGIFRILVAIILLGNIALFISSNSSVGASVYVVLRIDNGGNHTHIQLPSLFAFSLINSVHDMWVAKVYALSLLVAIFSGCWPYIKLLIMLFCWITPANILSISKRETLLLFVDKLGKWSLIDANVLILMMAAFHFHISTPPIPSFGVSETGIVDAYVTPEWGFFSFMIATILSLTLGHVVLGFHMKATLPPREHTSERESLANHTFKTESGTYTCTRFGKILVVLLLLISLGLVAFGASIDSFAFEWKGATGWILDLVNTDPKTSYSVISLGVALPGSADYPNSFGIRWIQVIYFIFVIVVPLAYLLSLLLLWLVPLASAAQKRLFVIAEVLDAWSALEVFVISVIAALLEIRQFAQFIIGNRCVQVNKLLAEYFASELDKDLLCFDVIATLDRGCWILFSASIIYLIVGGFVMKFGNAVLHEQPLKTQGNLQYDGEKNSKPSRFISLGKFLRLIH